MSETELTDDERHKYKVIRNVADNGGNKNRAAIDLGITKRQVNRLVAAYREHGIDAFSHGNKGRKPATTVENGLRDKIVSLYRDKYDGANFVHFTELLSRNEGIINISDRTVAAILEDAGILSPKVTRAKKKRVQKALRAKADEACGKRTQSETRANLVAVEDAHPSRPRCAYAGEMEQMDASPFRWFGDDNKTTLHIAIDDATGAITGAWFDREETLNGYYHVLAQIITNYGIPYKFRTDRRTVFTYKQLSTNGGAGQDENDTATQFAYACKQLGIAIETTSIPQAKGRVERAFETLQSRLPVEMRIAGVDSIDEANKFIESYLPEYNKEFALEADLTKSAYDDPPDAERINLTLAVLTERTIDSGHCLHFKNVRYRLLDGRGEPVYYRKGTKVMCVEAFDGGLYCCVNDADVYALDEVPESYGKSEELDPNYEKPTPRPKYIPPMNHPWRKSDFTKFVKAQSHRCGEDIEG